MHWSNWLRQLSQFFMYPGERLRGGEGKWQGIIKLNRVLSNQTEKVVCKCYFKMQSSGSNTETYMKKERKNVFGASLMPLQYQFLSTFCYFTLFYSLPQLQIYVLQLYREQKTKLSTVVTITVKGNTTASNTYDTQ